MTTRIKSNQITAPLTANVSFDDSARLTFGSSSELQIFSDGTKSYLIEGGSGDLEIRATDLVVKNADNTKIMAAFNDGGTAQLRYDNSAKLSTTSTGVSVTGTINTDDLIVSGNLTISGTSTTVNTDDLLIEDLNITLANGAANSAVADGAGITIDGADASLTYDHDSGQSHFDLNYGLTVTGSSNNSIAVLKAVRSNASGSNNTYTFEVDSSAHTSNLTSAGAMKVDVNSGRAFTINGFGHVGIGTDNPSHFLHIVGSDNSQLMLEGNDTNPTSILMDYNSTGSTDRIRIQNDAGDMKFTTSNGQVRQTILKTGNVGIGESAPDTTLHIKKNQSSAASSIKLENSAGGDDSSFDIDWQLASSGTSARIRAVRTNNPGAGDTNLVFSTSDNGTSVDDRLVINNLGRVLVGSGNHTADGITIGSVNGNSELDLAHSTAKRWRILSASTGDFYLQNKTDSYNSLIVTGNSSTGYLVSQFATQVRLVLGSSGAYNNNTSNWIRGNSDYLQFNNAGSGFTWETLGNEVMRLDSDGLGVGTNGPNYRLHVYHPTTNVVAKFESGDNESWVALTDNSSDTYGTLIGRNTSESTLFKVADESVNELFNIKQNGNVGIKTTNPSYALDVNNDAMSGAARFRRQTDGTSRNILLFYSITQGSTVGTIGITNTSTSYNTTSDYRLKENVVNLTDAINRVNQLQPKRFSWNVDELDEANIDGFIAHEVSDIVPEAVHGEKDEVDEEGNPVYQGIDQSKLVPLLTAAIKEQQTLIDNLTARIEALESS